jgi:colicin import membrane protein
VSLPAGYLDKKAATPVSKEVATISKREHAVAMKKVLEAPIKRLAPLKKDTSSELEKAIEGVRKKVEASSARQAATGPRERVAETNLAMNAYYEALWSRIKAEWALPRGILPSENLEAVIDVTIGRSGNVTSLNIEKGSGNRYFDQSAIRAIRKASPFPPIPDTIRGSEMDLGIRFHSSQFR